MMRWMFTFFVIVFCSVKPAVASSDGIGSEITVLNADTFVTTEKLTSDKSIIQLFKIENNQIRLLDAVEVKKRSITFKPLLEFRHLTIEEAN
jgi:hypothetical protein